LLYGAGSLQHSGYVLSALGRIARARGDAAAARTLVTDALAAHMQIGDPGYVHHMLYELGGLDADAGQLERSVQIAAAAVAWQERVGSRAWPSILRERDEWLVPARSVLGEERFARAWAEGQAMAPEQAVNFALQDVVSRPTR